MRVQREFLETPRLKLTLPRAEKHFGFDAVTCQAVLDVLVEANVLAKTHSGAYARRFPQLVRPAPGPVSRVGSRSDGAVATHAA
jgi:hypothetical protein